MTSSITLRRRCCPDCLGHRIEKLDWVTVNGDELVGDDPCDDYWCPDCEQHPSRTEEHEVTFLLCAACALATWGTSTPLPGVRVSSTGTIERCTHCALYDSDLHAARALGHALRARGGDGTVRFTLQGIG